MKRTKQWWARLTEQERSELVALERAESRSSRSAYIPDDCSECGHCSTPHLGSGLCPRCLDRLLHLIAKASSAFTLVFESGARLSCSGVDESNAWRGPSTDLAYGYE